MSWISLDSFVHVCWSGGNRKSARTGEAWKLVVPFQNAEKTNKTGNQPVVGPAQVPFAAMVAKEEKVGTAAWGTVNPWMGHRLAGSDFKTSGFP